MSAGYRKSIFSKLNQRGDTIIEVLIAIAVAASVLGIVFATSSRNIRATRAIQERSEATRLVQGQIEALRYVYTTNPSSIPASGIPFCLNVANVVTGLTAPPTVLANDNFSGYGSCKSGYYNYAIVEGSGANSGSYKFYARWDSLTVSGRDQVIMVYKVK